MGSLEPAFLPAGGSCNGVVPKGSIMANATTMMEKWQENYHYVFTELRDPTVDVWLFMSSPWPVLALCAVDYYNTEEGMLAADMTWWYFFSKFIDYLDSFFFVLRKKWGHLSTLHVVHHGIMPFTAWWGIRFVGGGHTTFCGFLNMGVHVVMYFYYLMSAMGPSVQKYLWWKRYL